MHIFLNFATSLKTASILTLMIDKIINETIAEEEYSLNIELQYTRFAYRNRLYSLEQKL